MGCDSTTEEVADLALPDEPIYSGWHYHGCVHTMVMPLLAFSPLVL